MQLRGKGRHGSCGKMQASKEEYLQVKRAAKSAVYIAKRDVETEQFACITDNSDKNQIFKMSKRLKRETDIVGENMQLDDGVEMASK